MIRDLSQISVMMVEDDETTRNVIKNSLLKNKINVVFDTAFVKDALNFAKQNRPEVAVLDYNLGPGPNGIDLANQLRKFQPQIGIVLLTAFLDPTQLKKRISELPKGSTYLIKHDVVDIQVLIDAIMQAFSNAI